MKFESTNFSPKIEAGLDDKELLARETGITKAGLAKVKNSPRLYRVFRVLALSLGLLSAGEGLAQKSQADQNKTDKYEQIENRGSLVRERNLELLKDGEYTASEEVFGLLARIIDPERPLGDRAPSGLYYSIQFLTPERKKAFTDSLKLNGYTKPEIKELLNIFSEGNIIFHTNTLNDENFVEVLHHERMHKEIDLLPEEKQHILNESRDAIVNDYKLKESEWVAETDEAWMSVFGDKSAASFEEKQALQHDYDEKIKAIVDKYKIILTNQYGLIDGSGDVASILRNPNEFYAYLIIGKLNPEIEQYLEANFPESAKIYKTLKERITIGGSPINNNIVE